MCETAGSSRLSADGLKTFIITEQFTTPRSTRASAHRGGIKSEPTFKSAERVVFYLTDDFLFLAQTGLWLCRVSVASACDAQSLPTSQFFKHVINVRLMRENDSIKSRETMLTRTAPGILQSSVERLFWWSVGLHWSHLTRHIDAKRYLLCLHEVSRDGTKHLYVMQWKWGWTPPGEWRRGDGAGVHRLLELELPDLAHLSTRSEAIVTNSSWRQLDTLKRFKPFLLSLSEHRHDTQTFSQRDFNFTCVCASQINKSLHAELAFELPHL